MSASRLVLGMSTGRRIVFLDDVLRGVAGKMHEAMKKNEAKYSQVSDPERTADVLGISSVMVQDMSAKRVNNYHFKMEIMTSFEGDTGLYLQYSHARLCSIFAKAGIYPAEVESADLSLLTKLRAADLVRLIAQFPDAILQTLRTHEPAAVLTNLFRPTQFLNSGYDVLRVAGSDKELIMARLALFGSECIVLNNGMHLLGLTPLDRCEKEAKLFIGDVY